MSTQVVGVRWKSAKPFHVELTDVGLVCSDDRFDDPDLLVAIQKAMTHQKRVFVVFEPNDYFTREGLPALEELEFVGMSFLGLADSEGNLADTDDDDCGLQCDYLFVALDGDSGTICFDGIEGTFPADGDVTFAEADDDFEDDDDEDDDFEGDDEDDDFEDDDFEDDDEDDEDKDLIE